MLLPSLFYNDNKACAALLPQNKNGNNTYDEEQNIIDNFVNNTKLNLLLNEVKVYPNPVKSGTNLTIVYNLENTAVVDVTDATGKLVQQILLDKGIRRVNTPINNLTSGIYYLCITSNRLILHQQKLEVVY